MPRKAKPSMVWDSNEVSLLPGETLEFQRKVFKTVRNKMRFRLVNKVITPILERAYIESVLKNRVDSFPRAETRYLRKILSCSSVEEIGKYIEQGEQELIVLKEQVGRQKELLKNLEKEAKRALREELISIYDKFGPSLKVEGKRISLIIPDVTIEGTKLGSFLVTLTLEKTFSLNIIPAFPEKHNYANGDPNSNYHPHISSSGRICFGTARDPVWNAFKNGLLFDIFCIMENYLYAYKSTDAYRKIHEWHTQKTPCGDCGKKIEEVYMLKCSCECGHNLDLCPECKVHCASCRRAFCGECVVNCKLCGEPTCDRCLTSNNLCQQCAVRERERRAGIERTTRNEEDTKDTRGIRYIGADGVTR